MSLEEIRQFWAEITALAEHHQKMDIIANLQHKLGVCDKNRCCRDPKTVYLEKKYPNYRIVDGLVYFD